MNAVVLCLLPGYLGTAGVPLRVRNRFEVFLSLLGIRTWERRQRQGKAESGLIEREHAEYTGGAGGEKTFLGSLKTL